MSDRSAQARLARGLLAGLAGGVAAGSLDLARALPAFRRLLPAPGGVTHAWGFLASLYGATFALAGLGLAVCLLLLRLALALGGTRRALPPALLVCAAALGAALYSPALAALLRFHHRTLIALLVGALGAALLALAPVAAALLWAALSRLPWLRGGRALGPGDGPLGLRAAGWALAPLLLGAALTGTFLSLQLHPRMNPPLRALNLALAAPPLSLCAAGLGYLAGRALSRLGGRGEAGPLRRLRGLADRPLGWILLPGLVILLPALAFALSYQATLRLLDLRPLTAAGCALVVGLAVALAWPGQGQGQGQGDERRLGRVGVVALALVPILSGAAALLLGQADRVRKAALSHAALAGPLVRALHAAFDLDRDGAPSRLVIGGSDCDDLDPTIHPGAFDWPGDGIDQNCNGHEAQLPDERRAPFPGLPGGAARRPSLLLITIDALRADHVGAYGYGRPTTPALDALARGGLRYESAWAHAPSTRYSVPAILTGRYPSTIAWGSPAQHWPPEVLGENRLVAEMLRERGYHTLALLSYHYFEPAWGLSQGFDEYDVSLMTLHSLGGDPAATSGSSARQLADLAVRKIEEQAAHPERPFFLWVHFYDPHFRYEVHPEVPRFGDGEQDRYDNEIRYTDLHIGRVLQALSRTGQEARTAVLLTADHGEGFGEHGIPPDRRHGYHLYANQTRVPLILRAPGLPAGQVVKAPVGHVDIAPTLLWLAGGQAADEPQLLGRPLPAQEEPGRPERIVFQEVMYEGPTVRKALVTSRWHFIRNVIPDGTTELYDLQADPAEEHDVQGAPQHRAAEADLSRTLAAWMDQSALPRDFQRRVAGNLSAAPLPFRRPIGAVLGDAVEIAGVDEPAGPVARGETAEIALVLRALSRVEPGWRIFMHLRGPGGFVNADHDLLEGLLPISQLRPGHFVRDVVRVPLPRSWGAGPATLLVGLYRRGERAPVRGPAAVIEERDRAVRAAVVEVR